MKYFATIDSDMKLARSGAIMAKATGSIGFNEQVQDAQGNIKKYAIGWREDSIPALNTRELVEVDIYSGVVYA
jgi:hypothetical protein